MVFLSSFQERALKVARSVFFELSLYGHGVKALAQQAEEDPNLMSNRETLPLALLPLSCSFHEEEGTWL